MPVDPNDPRPAYIQIADDLRHKIVSGKLTPGQRLPSGRQLAQEYGVAAMTVQQALGELEDVVIRWQGRGVFVREEGSSSPEADANPMEQIITELTSLRETVQALEQRVGNLEANRSRRS